MGGVGGWRRTERYRCGPLELCCKQKEGNKAGEDLPGSRWLRESLSSPGMEGGGEIREGEERRGKEITPGEGTLKGKEKN